MNLSTTDYEMIWVDFWLNLISVSIFESNLCSTPGQHIRWVWCSNSKIKRADVPLKRAVFTALKFDQNSGHIRPVT